ncbi:hypothetical protein F5880DRAFT_1149326 [Lentinula raphanica]|nr:hypothetical protein F5880DRAFT_1149326 [Lentinula raphanica]
MKLRCLDIHDTISLGSLDERMASKLKAIQINLFGTTPVSFSFLSALSSTRSTLQELWLFADFRHDLDPHIPPFLSSFVETSRQQDLKQFFMVTGVGVRRATGQNSQDWIVIGLDVQTTYNSSGSLIRILALIASSFPKLENFELDFNGHEATYHVVRYSIPPLSESPMLNSIINRTILQEHSGSFHLSEHCLYGKSTSDSILETIIFCHLHFERIPQMRPRSAVV